MAWLPKLARNLGLAVHHVIHPGGAGGSGGAGEARKQTVRHTVEEKQLDATTTLRRTTIEEIEVEVKKPAES